MRKYSVLNIIFLFLAVLVFLYIIAPITGMFLKTSFPQLFEAAKDKEVTNSIWLTVSVSMAATLFMSIGAIPLAYLLARKNFPLKRFVSAIIDLPIVVPHTAAGIAVLGFLSRDSVIGGFADSIGLSFVGSPLGIGAAMAFVSLPFLINSARDGFEAVPERLEKVSQNLGASKTKTFFKISLPMASRSIVTGIVMMFARGMSEFGAVVIIAYNPKTAPVMIYERFGAYGLKYARPVAVLFLIVCIVVFVLMRLLSERRRNVRD